MNKYQREEFSKVCAYILHTVGECADVDWVIRNIADGHSEALYSLAKRAMFAEQQLADAEDDLREMERQIRRERQQANVGVDVCERLNPLGNGMGLNKY